MKRRSMFFLLAVLFLAHVSIAQGQDAVVFSKFPKEQNIKLNEFLKFEQGRAKTLFLKDTTLFIRNSGGDGGYFFYQYGLAGKKMLNRYVKYGQGAGAMLSGLSSGIKGNLIWQYDLSQRKILTVSLNQQLGAVPAVREYPTADRYYSVQLLDTSTFVGGGVDNSKHKIEFGELPSGKTTAGYGVFENIPSEIAYNSWKWAYQSFLFARPTGDKAVSACRLADQIEIFDLVNHTSKVIKGPENFPAAFTPFFAGGLDIIIRNDESRFAFLNGMVNNDYIYLLYSGHQHESDYADTGRYIYVFDWNGTPVAKLDLGIYISGFTVSDDNTTIYAASGNNQMIMVGKMEGSL